MSRLTDLDAALRESFPEAVLEVHDQVDDVIVVDASRIVEVLRALRDDWAFELLSDVSGVDWLPREPRYDVNYHLYSIAGVDRLRVKVRLPDSEPRLASVYEVYPGADWHEREVFDFFGIVFEGHPDLKRILMPEEWIGHPLRKDYPVGGVPVEYRIEPAYVGPNLVPERAQPSSGGIPARLRRDRGQRSHWTWSGEPSSGMPRRGRPEPPEEPEDQGEPETKQGGST